MVDYNDLKRLADAWGATIYSRDRSNHKRAEKRVAGGVVEAEARQLPPQPIAQGAKRFGISGM
jgi:hypothetical protein